MDWVSSYSSSMPICGGVSFYPLYDGNDVQIDDSTSVLFNVATYPSDDFTVGLRIVTNDMTLEGDYIIKVEGYLTNYRTVKASKLQMQVKLKNCVAS